MSHMDFFLVGGAVRDTLLGTVVKDRDYVVVGATAVDLVARGFEQVGMGFPVFLHPETGEEYALARREKKVGAGYTGFEFETSADVTLEQDLERRDLTINSMAMRNGELVDPFGGQRDLKAKVLRHTSVAFGEDPLRVVRLARFYARYSKLGFTVAPETMELASQMVSRGDLDELPDERFWRELEKALSDKAPTKFFELLFEVGALNGVNFFKRLFGDFGVNGSRLKLIMQMAEACSKLEQADRVDVFAAWSAPCAGVYGLFDSARAGRMYDMLGAFNLLGSHPSAFEWHAFFMKCRAFSESSSNGQDLVLCLRTFEQAHGQNSSWNSSRIAAMIAVGKTVTADPYQHLQGKAIGEAMAQERVSKLASLFAC